MSAEAKLKAVRQLLAEPFAGYDLTPRERAVVRLAAKGMQPDEIAGRLGKSKVTVYHQLTSAAGKMNMAPGELPARLIREIERALA
jgi:DNA-binding CsgD family transcriptional regulator